MSQRLQNEIEALTAKVKTQGDAIVEVAYDVSQIEDRVAELEALLRAITRSSTPKGKAA